MASVMGTDDTVAAAIFRPVLARLQADAASYLGAADARLVPLAHQERPFSHLLRVGVLERGADHPARHLFVKVFKPKSDDGGVEKMRQRVAHDFAVTRRVFEAMAPWDGLDVVRPVACYVDDLAIVTEQAEGETLAAYLEANARWFPAEHTLAQLVNTMRRVGQWLRAFQSIEATNARVDLDDLRQYVDLRLVRLVAAAVIDDGERTRVLDHLQALARDIADSERREVLVHADLAPGNILVADRRIVVLDFAMMQRGSALHDISRLCLQLDVLRVKPHFRATIVRQLQQALLNGYDEALTPARPLFRYLSLLHRVNHLGTLALKHERFPARVFSQRVRRLHRRWIERELSTPTSGGTA